VDTKSLMFLPRRGSECKDYPYTRPFGYLSWEPDSPNNNPHPPEVKTGILSFPGDKMQLFMDGDAIQARAGIEIRFTNP
jgi:hypothetical protein